LAITIGKAKWRLGFPLPRGKAAENEARASVGGDVSVVSSELIGELMRKGVLAGDIGNGMLQPVGRPWLLNNQAGTATK